MRLSRPRVIAAVLVGCLLATACTQQPEHTNAGQGAAPKPSPTASTEAPLPSKFPELTDESNADEYVRTMFAIMTRYTQNPRSFERVSEMRLVRVDGVKHCDGAGNGVGNQAEPYHQMPVAIAMACKVDGKMTVLYGPKRLLSDAKTYGQFAVAQVLIHTYVMYMLNVTMDKLGIKGDDNYFMVGACVRGRLNGGLVKAGYLPPEYGRDGKFVAPDNTNPDANAFRQARDKGTCKIG